MSAPDPEQEKFQARVGEIEATFISMIAKCAQLVADSSDLVAPAAEVELRERIWSLVNGSTGEDRPKIFNGLRESIDKAFPDLKPTDTQILSNSATPDLVRYVISALRQIDQDSSPKVFKAAFLANRLPGKPGKMEVDGIAMRDAAFSAHADSLRTDRDPCAAYEAAMAAAMAIYRRQEGVESFDDRNRRTAEQNIARMLDREGLHRPLPCRTEKPPE